MSSVDLLYQVATADDFADDTALGAISPTNQDRLANVFWADTRKLLPQRQANKKRLTSETYAVPASGAKFYVGTADFTANVEESRCSEDTASCTFKISQFAAVQDITQEVFLALESALQSNREQRIEVYSALCHKLTYSIEAAQNEDFFERNENPAITALFLNSLGRDALPVQEESVYTEEELNRFS